MMGWPLLLLDVDRVDCEIVLQEKRKRSHPHFVCKRMVRLCIVKDNPTSTPALARQMGSVTEAGHGGLREGAKGLPCVFVECLCTIRPGAAAK